MPSFITMIDEEPVSGPPRVHIAFGKSYQGSLALSSRPAFWGGKAVKIEISDKTFIVNKQDLVRYFTDIGVLCSVDTIKKRIVLNSIGLCKPRGEYVYKYISPATANRISLLMIQALRNEVSNARQIYDFLCTGANPHQHFWVLNNTDATLDLRRIQEACLDRSSGTPVERICWTPLQWAVSRRPKTISDVLRQFGAKDNQETPIIHFTREVIKKEEYTTTHTYKRRIRHHKDKKHHHTIDITEVTTWEKCTRAIS